MLGKSKAYKTEDLKMEANYHTHTWRCRHASGTERDYIENAIDHGIRILGFSDHTPYPFPTDIHPDSVCTQTSSMIML